MFPSILKFSKVVLLFTKGDPYPPRTPPMKLDYMGYEDRLFQFDMADIEVRSSCLTEFNGDYYIFGGADEHMVQVIHIHLAKSIG